MCYPDGAHPPDLPAAMAGGAADGRSMTLQAEDGNRLRAYAALPMEDRGAAHGGMVVIPDIRGLMPFYEELALRFAEAGVPAVAIDLYCRTAGVDPHPEGFDGGEHAGRTTQSGIAADVAAAVRLLRSPEMGASAVFTVGFCFGGRVSFLQATEPHGLAGVVGFYGWPVGASRNDTAAPASVAHTIASPVLAFWGGADQGIPAEAVETFERALTDAGVEHESVTYPGAPHGFFDRHHERFANESADAWTRMLGFMARHGATA
jgi:carboxymethylenebutenolidase